MTKKIHLSVEYFILINRIKESSDAFCQAVAFDKMDELKHMLPGRSLNRETTVFTLGSILADLAFFIKNNPRVGGMRMKSSSPAYELLNWLTEAQELAREAALVSVYESQRKIEDDRLAAQGLKPSNRKLPSVNQSGDYHRGLTFSKEMVPTVAHYQKCLDCGHNAVTQHLNKKPTLPCAQIKSHKRSSSNVNPEPRQYRRVAASAAAAVEGGSKDDSSEDEDESNETKSSFLLCHCYAMHSHRSPDGGQCIMCIDQINKTGNILPNCSMCACNCRAYVPTHKFVNMARNVAVRTRLLEQAAGDCVAADSLGSAGVRSNGQQQWSSLLSNNLTQFKRQNALRNYDNPYQQNLDNNDAAASAVSFLTNQSSNVTDAARRDMQLTMGLPSAMIDGKHVNSYGGHDGYSSRHYRNDLPDHLGRVTSSSSSSGGEAHRTSPVPIAVVSDDLFKEAICLLGFEFEPEKEQIAKTLLGLTIPAEAAIDLTDEPSFSSVSSSIDSVTNQVMFTKDFDVQSSVATLKSTLKSLYKLAMTKFQKEHDQSDLKKKYKRLMLDLTFAMKGSNEKKVQELRDVIYTYLDMADEEELDMDNLFAFIICDY